MYREYCKVIKKNKNKKTGEEVVTGQPVAQVP